MTRARIHRIARCAAPAVATFVAAACASARRTPEPAPTPAAGECALQDGWKKDFIPAESRDYSRTRLTSGGLYRVSIKAPEAPPLDRLHRWVLHVEDAGGAAVDNATICVDGGMPEHGHGLPTSPALSGPSSHGDYRIDGMKFSMSGWWVVKFVVHGAAGVDSVRFNLRMP